MARGDIFGPEPRPAAGFFPQEERFAPSRRRRRFPARQVGRGVLGALAGAAGAIAPREDVTALLKQQQKRRSVEELSPLFAQQLDIPEEQARGLLESDARLGAIDLFPRRQLVPASPEIAELLGKAPGELIPVSTFNTSLRSIQTQRERNLRTQQVLSKEQRTVKRAREKEVRGVEQKEKAESARFERQERSQKQSTLTRFLVEKVPQKRREVALDFISRFPNDPTSEYVLGVIQAGKFAGGLKQLREQRAALVAEGIDPTLAEFAIQQAKRPDFLSKIRRFITGQ